jgi:hypothetical protein
MMIAIAAFVFGPGASCAQGLKDSPLLPETTTWAGIYIGAGVALIPSSANSKAGPDLVLRIRGPSERTLSLTVWVHPEASARSSSALTIN